MAEPTLRIVSDGTPRFTHVLLPDGTELKGVIQISMSLGARDDLVVVDLTIGSVALDINAQLGEVSMCCPGCNRDVKHSCKNL